MIAREQWEEVHTLVEVTLPTKWSSRVSSVLNYRFTHFLGNHTFYEYARVKGLVHISENDWGFIKEFTKIDKVNHPSISFGAILGIREKLFHHVLLPLDVEFKSVSLGDHQWVALLLNVFDKFDIIDALSC